MIVAAKQRLVELIAAEDPVIEVLYGRPDERGALTDRPWVSVGSASASFDVSSFRGDGSGVRWLQEWTVEIAVGSGVRHTDPAEADTVVYSTLETVFKAVTSSPRMNGLEGVVRVRPAGVQTDAEWIDGDARQTVLRATVTIQIRDTLD